MQDLLYWASLVRLEMTFVSWSRFLSRSRNFSTLISRGPHYPSSPVRPAILLVLIFSFGLLSHYPIFYLACVFSSFPGPLFTFSYSIFRTLLFSHADSLSYPSLRPSPRPNTLSFSTYFYIFCVLF